MIKYKYIECAYLKNYNGWKIEKILPAFAENIYDRAVISYEEIPVENSKKLNECSEKELIEELLKRKEK